jgi:hypothetical protein
MPKHVELEFKVIYSTNKFKLLVDIESTVTDFILFAKEKSKQILDISDEYEIEIVKAAKYFHENGRDPELAPALANSDYTLYQYYHDAIYYGRISFYVRIKKDNAIVKNLKIIIPNDNSVISSRGTPPPPFSHYDSDDDWVIKERAL